MASFGDPRFVIKAVRTLLKPVNYNSSASNFRNHAIAQKLKKELLECGHMQIH